MAVLETIRTKFGVIITVLIAIALLSFIVDPSSLISAFNSSQNVVGKIDGKKIDYIDYKEKLDAVSALYGNNSSEEAQNQMQEMAWQYFLDRDLFFPAAKKSGIQVSETEVTDLLVGANLSPVLRQYLGNMSDAQIREYIPQIIAASATDAQANAFWTRMKKDVYDYRMHEKYNTLFAVSSMPNDLTKANFVTEANTADSVRYVMVPFGYQKDTTIVVSEKEIKARYNKLKSTFTQKASRDIEYVLFRLEPSEKDRETIMTEFEGLIGEFNTISDFKKFSKKKYLEKPEYWFKQGELSRIHPAINDSNIGQTIVSGDELMAVRIVDTKMLPDSVFIHHIAVGANEALADSIVKVATTSNFAALAQEKTLDGTTGEGQWLSQSQLLQNGLIQAIQAETGKAFKIENGGINVVFMVSKKTALNKKNKVVILKETVYPSTETQNALYAQANEFSNLAGTSVDGLRAASSQQGQYLNHENITEASKNISGVSARELTRWAFGAEQGAVSGVLKAGQNYFVAALTGIHEDGIASLSEVKAQIENGLYAEKRAEKVLAEVKEKIQGLTGIDQIAEALSTSVSTKDNVSFSSLYPQGAGVEAAFLGGTAATGEGELSTPFAGKSGVYVLVVEKRETGDSYDPAMVSYFQQMVTRQNAEQLTDEMFKMTKSVDNRAHFF